MSKIKVMSIFGTRPEAIKMAPLIKELKRHIEIESIVCVTAQHREMLDQVLDIFKIKPDFDLNIMKSKQSLTDITINALKGLEVVIENKKPDIILVHGDTTTTFVASLAAFYYQIKIGHVEAGLRTFNKYEPFPEEMNRRLTGALADIHFAPTALAKKNLMNEGLDEKNIFVTGNTAIDGLKETIEENYKFTLDLLNNIDYKNKKVITMTAHRRENWGEPLENICKATYQIVEEFKDVEIVYAVHKNPVVMETAQKYLGSHERIHLIEPLDIKDMHNLIKRSFLVMTDSGGLQEEVPSMGKPVMVLRNVTERPEGVEAGTLKIAGVYQENVFKLASELITNKNIYDRMVNAINPFGDGHASERIVEAIQYKFGLVNKLPRAFEY